MMRRFVCAVAFLTRAPLPSSLAFDAADVGRSMMFFPLVGALLGCLAVAERHLLARVLPPGVLAFLMLGTMALATGALHLDGLADMADGFGGGRTRDDVLRIMRDHVIGAYGACALVFVVGVQVSALAVLLGSDCDRVLIVAPMLSRWGGVPIATLVPYARSNNAAMRYVGAREVIGATVIAGVGAIGLLGWQGLAMWGAVMVMTALQARWCIHKIGGVTGDTTGANIVACEALIYVLALL
jgi:cobalamin 5'-phosphate synthase/cobalamin synthase